MLYNWPTKISVGKKILGLKSKQWVVYYTGRCGVTTLSVRSGSSTDGSNTSLLSSKIAPASFVSPTEAAHVVSKRDNLHGGREHDCLVQMHDYCLSKLLPLPIEAILCHLGGVKTQERERERERALPPERFHKLPSDMPQMCLSTCRGMLDVSTSTTSPVTRT